jgi:hypothetical protein
VTAFDVRARAAAAAALAPIAQGGSGQVVQISRPGVTEVQIGSGVEETYSARSIDGTLIMAGDKRFLLSPLNDAGAPITPPEPDLDRLTLADGVTWAIKTVEPAQPAGLACMFILQLRASG